MPPTSPDTVVLTDAQRADLDRLIRSGRTQQRLALRAGIVLAAADGHSNARIAASLGVCQDTARKWRHRWCAAPGVPSLGDAKRSGRPAVFSPVQVAQVKAVACTLPKDYGLPLGDVGEADEFGPADQIEGGGQHGLKPDGFSFQARQVAQPGGLGLADSVFDAGVFGGDAVPTGPPARGSTPVGVSVRMAVIRCPSPSAQ